MIGLDTNILVRYLTHDDQAQTRTAHAFFASLSSDAPGFVAREVLLELVWVLQRTHRYSRADIAEALNGLLDANELWIEDGDRVGSALALYAAGGPGFSDQMIRLAALAAGCSELVTFDAKAAREPGVRLLC